MQIMHIISFDFFQVKNEDSNTPPDSPNVFSPLFGISNAYFLSQQQQSSITAAATSAALNSLKSPNSALNSLNSPNKIIKDIPSLLSQHPLNPSLIQNLQQLTANPKPDLVQRPSSNPANGKFLRFSGLLCFISMKASVRTELADSMVTPGEPGGD